jgi:hypothetical protein
MTEHRECPWRTWRTGTEHGTITETHPAHRPVGNVDHKGGGADESAYDPHGPWCRAEESRDEHT